MPSTNDLQKNTVRAAPRDFTEINCILIYQIATSKLQPLYLCVQESNLTIRIHIREGSKISTECGKVC